MVTSGRACAHLAVLFYSQTVHPNFCSGSDATQIQPSVTSSSTKLSCSWNGAIATVSRFITVTPPYSFGFYGSQFFLSSREKGCHFEWHAVLGKGFVLDSESDHEAPVQVLELGIGHNLPSKDCSIEILDNPWKAILEVDVVKKSDILVRLACSGLVVNTTTGQFFGKLGQGIETINFLATIAGYAKFERGKARFLAQRHEKLLGGYLKVIRASLEICL